MTWRLPAATPLAVVLAMALAAGCASASPSAPGTSAAGPSAGATPTSGAPAEPTSVPSPTPLPAVCAAPCDVGILNVAFHPADRHVQAGTEIVWTNKDPETHTVTFDDGTIDSHDIPPGAVFKHTFMAAGTFTYRCVIHADMRGTIVVTP